MKPLKAVVRRRLDQALSGLDAPFNAPPARGWIRTLRDALGMSTLDLATRMGVTPTRVSQAERAEARGNVTLATLERAAAGLGCRLRYVLVPDEPLEEMVRRQAHVKAAQAVAEARLRVGPADRELLEGMLDEQVDALAVRLVDSHWLWRDAPPPAGFCDVEGTRGR